MTNRSLHHNPLISIIISTLNSERSLERCIQSITVQDYKEKEIIIKDGGSSDNTINIIKKYEPYITYWESLKDRGIYDAWNKALPHCSGDWICFIGSDDYFINENILSAYTDFIKEASSSQRVVYGVNHVVNSVDKLLYTIGRPWEDIAGHFRKIMCLPHPGLMHHASLFTEHGNFNVNFDIAGDYEFLLRELKTRDALFWPHVVCAMPVGGISTMPSNSLKCLNEIRKAKKLNCINQLSFVWLTHWMTALIRLLAWKMIGEQKSRVLSDLLRLIRRRDPFWTKAI